MSAAGVRIGPGREAPLVLASASPRRKRLLEAAGIDFEVAVYPVEETVIPGRPAATARANALRKARRAARRRPAAIIIAADTVVFRDRVLGKPSSPEEARRMLESLSGTTHRVYTAISVIFPGGGGAITRVAVSRVKMKKLEPDLISAYLRRVDATDKAGAYAIQEHGGMLIENVTGSYTNVVGLPLETLAAVLHRPPLFDGRRLLRAAARFRFNRNPSRSRPRSSARTPARRPRPCGRGADGPEA